MSDRRTIETGSDDLLAHVEDRVAVLTMNRPERRNAFSSGMIEGLQRALVEAETADDIGCVVLTGAGPAFCAGGDVKGMAESEGGSGESTKRFTASGSPNAARLAASTKCPSPSSQCFRVRLPARGLASPWPATSALLPKTRS